MKDFWNDRYGKEAYAYGEKPNQFFEAYLNEVKPGHILLPAEGEGRNAVFAARKGWNVEAFDFSESGKEKALRLAKKYNVDLHYELVDFAGFSPQNAPFDVIALIYVHTDPQTRLNFLSKAFEYLKEGGELLMEVYSEKQLGRNSGGPKNINMLWTVEEMKLVFKPYNIIQLEETEIELNEGEYHQGKASVIRAIIRKDN